MGEQNGKGHAADSRKRDIWKIIVIPCFLVLCFVVALLWRVVDWTGNELFYGFYIQFGLTLLAAFILTFLIGVRNYYGIWKWAVCFLFALLFVVSWACTYDLDRVIKDGWKSVSLAEEYQDYLSIFLWGLCPSVLGTLIGVIVRFFKRRA